MKSRSLKIQIATTFIILLSVSMFMLSCVWVLLTKKALIEKEIALLEVYANSLADDLQAADVACYRVQFGKVIEAPESAGCTVDREIREKAKEGREKGEKIFFTAVPNGQC